MGNKIVSLAMVARSSKFDSRITYAGWTDSGLPAVKYDSKDLDADAQDQARTFLSSGYPIPILPLRRQLGVVVVEFAGPVQDLKDPSPKALVQDSIRVTVTDSNGDSMDLSLGELEVLEMIGSNIIVFQKFGSVLDTSERREAVSYFSFFLPGNSDSGEEREDLLVLMKPTNENLGNIIDAVLFIQDVVKKLLANDQKQPPEYRKRYLEAGKEADEEIAQELKKNGGFFSFLLKDEATPQGPSVGDSLGEMIKDMLKVTPKGQKVNPFLKKTPMESDALPDQKTLDRMRHTAAKMFGFAKSRIRSR